MHHYLDVELDALLGDAGHGVEQSLARGRGGGGVIGRIGLPGRLGRQGRVGGGGSGAGGGLHADAPAGAAAKDVRPVGGGDLLGHQAVEHLKIYNKGTYKENSDKEDCEKPLAYRCSDIKRQLLP